MRKRFIWEEISQSPCIFGIKEADSGVSGFLFLDGKDALVIDPCSSDMLRSTCRLAQGMGVEIENIQVFLTYFNREEACEVVRTMPEKMTLYSAAEADIEQATVHVPWHKEPARVPVKDGDLIRIGESILRVIGMEGFRKNQIGIWYSDEGILFSGAALGLDPLPAVQNWDERIDTLGLQIETIHRVRSLSPQCILLGTGAYIGLDALMGTDEEMQEEILPDQDQELDYFVQLEKQLSGSRKLRKKISTRCAEMLDGMLEKYCLRIVEIFQKIPSGSTIREEKLMPEDDVENGRMTAACLKYLLYRKYVKRHEYLDGNAYERGSMRLTDWNV